jgi:hypothetical protein
MPAVRVLLVAPMIAAVVMSADAQPSRRPTTIDSALVRTLTAGIVAAVGQDLGGEIAFGGALANPWTVVVEDSTSDPWGQVQRGLRAFLGHSDAAAAAPHSTVVRVYRLQRRRDTASVIVDVHSRIVTPAGCITEGGMNYLVQSTYRRGQWTTASARAYRDDLHAPCPSDARIERAPDAGEQAREPSLPRVSGTSACAANSLPYFDYQVERPATFITDNATRFRPAPSTPARIAGCNVARMMQVEVVH